MSIDRNDSIEVRMELKYCERCGALRVRERGTGLVYCDSCQLEVADLPTPKKRTRRVRLPVGPNPRIEDCGVPLDDESRDFEAVGGVA